MSHLLRQRRGRRGIPETLSLLLRRLILYSCRSRQAAVDEGASVEPCPLRRRSGVLRSKRNEEFETSTAASRQLQRLIYCGTSEVEKGCHNLSPSIRSHNLFCWIFPLRLKFQNQIYTHQNSDMGRMEKRSRLARKRMKNGQDYSKFDLDVVFISSFLIGYFWENCHSQISWVLNTSNYLFCKVSKLVVFSFVYFTLATFHMLSGSFIPHHNQ